MSDGTATPESIAGTRSGPCRETLLDILDGTGLIFYLKRADGRYLFVNRRYAEVANVPAEALVDKRDEDLFPEPVARLFREQDERVIRERRPLEFEETIPLPGGVMSFITSKYPLIDDNGEVYAVGGFCTDITSTRAPREDETLAAERERLSVTFRSISESVISTDLEGAVLNLNESAERLLDCSQAVAYRRPLMEVLPLGGLAEDPVRAIVTAGERQELGEHRFRRPDGETCAIELSGAPVRDRAGVVIGAVFSARDVTARLRMEDELLNARKLESLGHLAGGIAHDFNNLLTTVFGNISMARQAAEDPERVRRHLQISERALIQARGLTRQLLTFSRRGEPRREKSDVGRLIREAAAFSLSGSNTRLSCRMPGDLWPAEVDRAQIGQVIQNLTINARQAMPDGGEVEISCRNLEPGDEGFIPGPEGDRFVEVVVSDQGPGFPPDALDRIFDPYFSTRQDGSGLGLSIVFSIVRRHGGSIVASNPPGGGARLRMVLPACEGEARTSEAEEPRSVPEGARVLVMDDDVGVRETLATVLMCLGYAVEHAADGREAVDRHRRALGTDEAFDLLILDLTIVDGLGGVETLRAIRAFDPDVKAIISSGYAEDPCLVEYRQHGFAGAILKPYSIDELNEIIVRVLDA